MDVKREALEEFETYHCLHWALLISTESLVLLFSLLLRVILWGKKISDTMVGEFCLCGQKTRSSLLKWASAFFLWICLLTIKIVLAIITSISRMWKRELMF